MYRTVVTICTAQWSLYVPHSGHYMYRTVVTVCTAQLTHCTASGTTRYPLIYRQNSAQHRAQFWDRAHSHVPSVLLFVAAIYLSLSLCLSMLSLSLSLSLSVDSFGQFRKASVTLVMSVRLSACIISAATEQIRLKFGIGCFYVNLSRKSTFGYNPTKIIGTHWDLSTSTFADDVPVPRVKCYQAVSIAVKV